jgi:hypothetical protein
MHKVEVTTSSRNGGNTVLPAALSVEQGNCLIAEFMGMERTEKETGEPTFKQEQNAVIWASQLMYKNSWDWLMPVVEKIEDNFKAHITIYNKQCWVEFYGIHDDPCQFHNKDKSTIENIWLSIVSFIEWHNQQGLSKGSR